MRFFAFCLLAIPGFCLASAAGQVLNGPIAGYVFDPPTGSFRAVQGFPGSASLGPALAQGFNYGSVAPLKNYAIAFEKSQIKLVIGLGTGHVSVMSIAAVLAKAEGVAWSGDGSTAVIYSRTGNWLQILTGFPATVSGCGARGCSPAVVESVEVSAMHATLSSVALDAHGTQVALGVTGERAGVYVSTDRRGFVLLLRTSHPSSLSFSDDGSELYAIDESNADLSAVNLRNLSVRSNSLTGLQDPFAIKFGRDASGLAVVYVASRKNRHFRTYTATNQRLMGDIALSFIPTRIDELGTKSFLLSSRTKAGDPLWLFSSSPPTGVYFVPSSVSEGTGQ
jgi:hypothetical protein